MASAALVIPGKATEEEMAPFEKSTMIQVPEQSDPRPWVWLNSKYGTPTTAGSIWQFVNSLALLSIAFVAMYYSLRVGYWLTLLIAPVTAGLVIRMFMILHDCGHGSFFKSKRANDLVGFWCGVITATPYKYWRKLHAVHHANSGDLSRRGQGGDIYTMTLDEYRDLNRWGRIKYRLYRNPLILFTVGAWGYFYVFNRFHFSAQKGWKREIRNVYQTDAALVGVVLAAWLFVPGGLWTFFIIYAPVAMIAAAAGMWLFYVQHQYEEAYWDDAGNWSYLQAAVQGSSYLKLPALLRWFTSNIGIHHIHHMAIMIPNYRLRQALRENPQFLDVPTLTILSAFKSAFLHVWDPTSKKLISFRRATKLLKQEAPGRLSAAA